MSLISSYVFYKTKLTIPKIGTKRFEILVFVCKYLKVDKLFLLRVSIGLIFMAVPRVQEVLVVGRVPGDLIEEIHVRLSLQVYCVHDTLSIGELDESRVHSVLRIV